MLKPQAGSEHGTRKRDFFTSLYTAHVAIKDELKDEEISGLIKKVIYIFILFYIFWVYVQLVPTYLYLKIIYLPENYILT